MKVVPLFRYGEEILPYEDQYIDPRGGEIFPSQQPWQRKFRCYQGDIGRRESFLKQAAAENFAIERVFFCNQGEMPKPDVLGRVVAVVEAGDVSAVIRHCFNVGHGYEVVEVLPATVWMMIHAGCRHCGKRRR